MRAQLILLGLFLVSSAPAQQAQAPRKPFEKTEVQDLLAAGADSERVAKLVEQRGINFDPTDEYLETLRKAGAKEALLKALREMREKNASASERAAEMVLRVSSNERAWVSVDADGKPVLERVLNPPESETVKAKKFFDLTTDNAQALSLTLDGVPLKPLGRRWEVKSVHLTPESAKELRAEKTAKPPESPPKSEPPKQLRVSGQVQAAKAIFHPTPQYPPLARLARIGGTVRLQAVIGKDGVVRELKALSGDPMLVKAAMEAVGHWRYQPTLLNGEPVEVITEIDVVFSVTAR